MTRARIAPVVPRAPGFRDTAARLRGREAASASGLLMRMQAQIRQHFDKTRNRGVRKTLEQAELAVESAWFDLHKVYERALKPQAEARRR